MNKYIFLSFLSLLLFFFCFSCSSTKTVDNTFLVTIENDSNFTIVIDNVNIAHHSIEKHKFPLHESALYDGWEVLYEICLNSSIKYTTKEKIYLADGQKNLKISNPKNENIEDSYCIIKNESSYSLQPTDKKHEKIFPCYKSGIINQKNLTPTYNIASGEEVICKLGKSSLYLINPLDKNNILQLPCEYKKGYSFKVLIKNGIATLIDERPISCMGEKAWAKEYQSKLLRSCLQKDNSIYVLGTEKTKDKKGNLYSSGFLECLDSNGNELWNQQYAKPGTDTFLYDMAIFKDGTILISGQSIGKQMTGILLNYDSNGNLLHNITITESIGLESIISISDGTFFVSGYDSNEKPILFKLNEDLKYTKTVPFFDAEKLHKLLQSENKILSSRNGTFFIAGETSYLEKPTASIVSISKKGNINAIYTSKEPFSFVTDIYLNEEKQTLVFTGSTNAQDSFGNAGTPFIRCIDLKTNEIIWENTFQNTNYEVCTRFFPCEKYGFIQILANADSDGDIQTPCEIIRTNSIGKQ